MQNPQAIAAAIRAARKAKKPSEMGGVTGPGEVMEENDDYLSQDADPMEMDLSRSSNELGNADQEEARKQARLARVLGRLRPSIDND